MENDTSFTVILEFVKDLWGIFGHSKTTTPLARYHSQLLKIKAAGDQEKAELCINGFRDFFQEYRRFLINSEELVKIPDNTIISYSKRIYLEIKRIIDQAGEINKEKIRQHLLVISKVIDDVEVVSPTAAESGADDFSSKILEKAGLNDGSKEGEFVANIMQKTRSVMENIDTKDPSAAVMGLLSGGIVTDVMSGLQAGISDGSMDMNKLMGSMQGILSTIMSQNAVAAEEKRP